MTLLSQNVDSGGHDRQHHFRRRTCGETKTPNSQHDTGMSHLLALCFIVLHRYCVFLINGRFLATLPPTNLSVVFCPQRLLTSCLCHILVILPTVPTFLLFLHLLWQSVISDLWCPIVIVSGLHELCPHEMANNKCCVCSNWPTDQPFPCLGCPYSLRHGDIEIRLINNPTMASKSSSDIKN